MVVGTMHALSLNQATEWCFFNAGAEADLKQKTQHLHVGFKINKSGISLQPDVFCILIKIDFIYLSCCNRVEYVVCKKLDFKKNIKIFNVFLG